MPIPPSQFKNWSSPGADKGSKTAADKIQKILELDRSPIDQSDFIVRRQGSYKNTTHTRDNSDVDVIAKLTSAWWRDLSELESDEVDRYHDNNSSTDYGYTDFRQDVWNWIQTKFDRNVISWNGKAIEISKESGRLPDIDVDLVPCIEYRYYTNYPEYGEPDCDEGMAFKSRYGSEKIINYPALHYENGCDMHDNYKETVRIFKNARDYYNNHFDTLWTIGAHSYGIECLISNVPKRILKRSNRADRFYETLQFLDDADFSTFDQVSKMEPLFGDSNTQWNTDEADDLVTRLSEMWDDWNDKTANAQLLY
ncbi:nucleotidyltransferase [Halalkalicoccus sp. NIPERK01]|uniref:nucleotidyltransferase n=1 Tax=Halalkalicoccus sp. NIPERK01 TaxID=3053469 RepID=UPI00256F007B|nr:nucleotidyltransferase [Halalkalicoccus sp. NIPERK01]MDL5363891.1 nucleotidyltransferase [Halalkalicoccus sp. NIPERK01]